MGAVILNQSQSATPNQEKAVPKRLRAAPNILEVAEEVEMVSRGEICRENLWLKGMLCVYAAFQAIDRGLTHQDPIGMALAIFLSLACAASFMIQRHVMKKEAGGQGEWLR